MKSFVINDIESPLAPVTETSYIAFKEKIFSNCYSRKSYLEIPGKIWSTPSLHLLFFWSLSLHPLLFASVLSSPSPFDSKWIAIFNCSSYLLFSLRLLIKLSFFFSLWYILDRVEL